MVSSRNVEAGMQGIWCAEADGDFAARSFVIASAPIDLVGRRLGFTSVQGSRTTALGIVGHKLGAILRNVVNQYDWFLLPHHMYTSKALEQRTRTA